MSNLGTDLLDNAIIFATNAHKGVFRRGKGFAYIVHPMEAMSIAATMTEDQELLAAAALHDVVEDTDCTYAKLEKLFGKRVATLVETDSVEEIEGEPWRSAKERAIYKIANADIDGKIVSLSDKLSNMRWIARDYEKLGNALWNRFHTHDPLDHEWHYRALAIALDDLEGTEAYREFVYLIEKAFSAQAGFKGSI